MEQERLRTECAELTREAQREDAAVAVLRTGIEHNRASIERVENDLRDQSGRAGEPDRADRCGSTQVSRSLAAQAAELEESRAFLAQAERSLPARAGERLAERSRAPREGRAGVPPTRRKNAARDVERDKRGPRRAERRRTALKARARAGRSADREAQGWVRVPPRP